MTSTYTSYAAIADNISKAQDRVAKEPPVARETAYYRDNIGSIKTIDDFLKNVRLFSYAVKAFGLGDLAYAKGLFKKVLKGGVTDPNSFANKLSDTRFRDFAKAFDFATYGDLATTLSAAKEPVVKNYIQQQLQTEAGSDNPGVKLALYFRQKAPSLKSAYGILADKALLEVVQTTLGIPKASVSQNIDRQARDIAAKVNVADFKDPAKLDKFLKRFTTLYDTTQTTSQSPATSLQAGFGADLLLSFQNLRIGR